jgi:hypothetical protein
MVPDPDRVSEYKVAAEAPRRDGELPSDPTGSDAPPDPESLAPRAAMTCGRDGETVPGSNKETDTQERK